MKKIELFVLGILAVALLAAIPVKATTCEECKGLVVALMEETVINEKLFKTKDYTGLIGKLTEAMYKLDQGKYGDAIQKLTDYKNKVITLGNTKKLDPLVAGNLAAKADLAIVCIGNINSTP